MKTAFSHWTGYAVRTVSSEDLRDFVVKFSQPCPPHLAESFRAAEEEAWAELTKRGEVGD